MAETDPRGVFLSYRREDTPHMAGRLADRLKDRFGEERVFMDVEALDPGVDFADAIETEVSRCDVMIVLIGTEWSRETHGTGEQRLLNPQDFVALEVGTALARGIRVIPVLVEGARLPSQEEMPESLQPLLRRHAVRLDHDSFRAQVGPLIESVRTALDAAAANRAGDAETSLGVTRSRERIDPREQTRRSSSSEPEGRLSHGQPVAPAAGSGRVVAGQTADRTASGIERRPAPPEADAETVALQLPLTGPPHHRPVTTTSQTTSAQQVTSRKPVSRTFVGRERRLRRRAVLAIVTCVLVLAGVAAWQTIHTNNVETKTLTVDNQIAGWYETEIDVESGDLLRLTASGMIGDNRKIPSRQFGPEGMGTDPTDVEGRFPHCALLGRLGSQGEAFLIGRSVDISDQVGRLYLMVNDRRVDDNTGSFEVRAERTSSP